MEDAINNVDGADDDDRYADIPTFEKVLEQRKSHIAWLKEGDAGQQRVADLLSKCRKNARCYLLQCPVCERRKLMAQRIPADADKGFLGTSYPIRSVYIERIRVPGKRRPLEENKLRRLAASIDKSGLQTPISVVEKGKQLILVCGWYRLEAVKRLGWASIPCIVLPNDDVPVRLWQIDENLCRAELTVLQSAEATVQKRDLIRQMPREDGQVAPPGGNQPNDIGINKSAKLLGITREEVRRSIAIAGLSPKVKARVTELGLDDNQQALLEVARKPTPDSQLECIEEIVERKRLENERRASEPREDDKEILEFAALRDQVRQGTAELAARRKQLKLLEDRQAVKGEAAHGEVAAADPGPLDEEAADPAPLDAEDEEKAQDIAKTLEKFPILRAKLANASVVVLDRAIALVRAGAVGQ